MQKIRSFCGKGSLRQGCRRDFVRGLSSPLPPGQWLCGQSRLCKQGMFNGMLLDTAVRSQPQGSTERCLIYAGTSY